MKKQEFWKQVNQRVRENKQITAGGVPQQMASLVAPLGLHFWLMGAGLALVPTLWMWSNHYEGLMRLVRMMIWR